jgi:hypothetical protein
MIKLIEAFVKPCVCVNIPFVERRRHGGLDNGMASTSSTDLRLELIMSRAAVHVVGARDHFLPTPSRLHWRTTSRWGTSDNWTTRHSSRP